jgi:hypothetical protein
MPLKEVHGEHHLTDNDEACRYLDEIAQRTFPPDVDVVPRTTRRCVT